MSQETCEYCGCVLRTNLLPKKLYLRTSISRVSFQATSPRCEERRHFRMCTVRPNIETKSCFKKICQLKLEEYILTAIKRIKSNLKMLNLKQLFFLSYKVNTDAVKNGSLWLPRSTSCLFYRPRPKAEAADIDLGFDNSEFHVQPHPITVY